MADVSDVESALLTYAASALLTLGVVTEGGVLVVTEGGVALMTDGGAAYMPGTVATGPTGLVRMMRGWPPSTALEQDIRPIPGVSQPIANVSVQIDASMSRNTTRYMTQFQTVPAGPVTLVLAARGTVVTVNGTPAVGQVCGILVGPSGRAVGYAYRIQAGDTCVLIATALAALIPGATASGVIVTLPTDLLTARVVQDATALQEVRRQEAAFRIVVFAPTPSVRDALSAAIDLAIAPMALIGLPDGSTCYVRYVRTFVMDASAQSFVWRRDLLYLVEYPTVLTSSVPEMLFGDLASGPGAPVYV